MPVNCISRQVFQLGDTLHRKLNTIEYITDQQQKVRQLIEMQRVIGRLASTYQLTLNDAYEQAEEYKKAAKESIKLVDKHIRFYRYAEISERMKSLEEAAHNSYEEASILQARRTMQSFGDVIKQSIHKANQRFNPIDNIDEDIVYLAQLSVHTEIGMRYYAKHMKHEDEGDFFNYYDILDRGGISNELDRLQQQKQQEESFINQAQERISDAYEGEVDIDGL